jgi:D-alanyl-D-alanine dipeptidase
LHSFFLLLQLIINSLYGKLIESVSKRSIARFNRDIVQAMRNATSPLFTGEVIYNEDFSISYLKKKFLQMNKTQWAVGFSINDKGSGQLSIVDVAA